MQIIETILTPTPDGVIADIAIAEKPSDAEPDEWLRFRVSVKCEEHWALAAIQRAALQHIQTVIGAEIDRTAHIVNQRPG